MRIDRVVVCVIAGLALAGALVGCAKTGPEVAHAPGSGKSPKAAPIVAMPPEADSVTVGLWRFDERGGNHATDASPFRLYGTSGPETRPEFGRFKGARGFTATAQSFVYMPYNPVMESPRGFSVEAWVYLNDISRFELSMITARWTPVPNEQSWFLGVVGRKLLPASTGTPSPGWFTPEVALIGSGHLVFGFRPDLAAGSQSFGTTATLPLGRWVHIAATVDGEVVRLYIDGRLDVQVAVPNGIRRSDAPLVVGNVLDPRRLTEFGSDLRMDPNSLPLPYYALNGSVDELRISNVARTSFETTGVR